MASKEQESGDGLRLVFKAFLRRPIAYQRVFAEIGGGALTGLFLSQAYYWSQHTQDVEGWFYKTMKEWHEETAMTRREQETARAALRKQGILEETRRGHPCTVHYRVSETDLIRQLKQLANPSQNATEKEVSDDPPVCTKRANYSLYETSKPVCTKRANQFVRNEQTIHITETTSEITTEIPHTPTPVNAKPDAGIPHTRAKKQPPTPAGTPPASDLSWVPEAERAGKIDWERAAPLRALPKRVHQIIKYRVKTVLAKEKGCVVHLIIGPEVLDAELRYLTEQPQEVAKLVKGEEDRVDQ